MSAISAFQAQWLLCIPLIPTTLVYPDSQNWLLCIPLIPTTLVYPDSQNWLLRVCIPLIPTTLVYPDSQNWLLCIPLIPTTLVYPDRIGYYVYHPYRQHLCIPTVRIITTLHITTRFIFIRQCVLCEVGTVVQYHLYSFQPPKGSRICRNECNVVETKRKY